MPDILDPNLRADVLGSINDRENIERKNESLKRFEVYRERQHEQVLEKLRGEFSSKTVDSMRKITSINIATRIINEQASIYKRAPVRNFGNVNERQKEQLENLYSFAKANVQFKRANRVQKLQDQGCLQVLPANGMIQMRTLHPHHYDVVPMPGDPETAWAYVLSVFNKDEFLNANPAGKTRTNTRTSESAQSDNVNQVIADKDDWKGLSNKRFIWWTAEHSFMTNGKGEILSEQVDNPIGMLPFVDIAGEKDFEFFVRNGNNTVSFALDFALLLSDTSTINRLQGYSQAVIQSDDLPENVLIGPNQVLHLPPNKDGTPSTFQFVTPSPDMGSALNLLELYLRLFLSSRGLDPKTVSGTADTQRFNSGIERLLAMIEKFESSEDDIDLFRSAEDDVFKIMTAWSNVLQGTGLLRPELTLATIPDNAFIDVAYSAPEVIKTSSESEDSVIKRMEAGLLSRVEAIAEIREIDIDEARKVVEEIDTDEGVNQGPPEPTPPQPVVQLPQEQEEPVEDGSQPNGS